MIVNSYEDFKKELNNMIKKYRGKFGGIIGYDGFVRDYDVIEGKKVPCKEKYIESNIINRLKLIEEEVRKRYDIIDILIYHNTGLIKVGERLAAIRIFAKHRNEAFKALEYFINEMKKYH
ncbi:molybdopterin biosynthesis MoaE protein [Methanocaldococcus villosus KIN24-T80]|uniref:Molybdopterin biosynthesis MoaE protein n=1 Tax=Methanocaldococcus villosus KIN24-T80 TaxID=1069083 RepID=N6VTF2_9EURY|nr:molybdenum cofactor biosynthesis protein MoaE [Methanocaldococcus villosus]ENN96466.1 molybdopterin biosynthesis MoaE protein [Methanocaldococcus villosus KIN24-T80]